MQKGTVKKWDSSRGYGFIITENDEEIFVNVNDLHVTIKDKRLIEGQPFSFDIKSDMKGERAVNVRRI